MYHFENRLADNLTILAVVAKFLKENPQLRFWQALVCLNIIKYDSENLKKAVVLDGFYEESSETLKNLRFNQNQENVEK